MAVAKQRQGSDLFIVDNSDQDWKVRRYLRDWCDLAQRMDIATGYFEIGALLALEGEWQKVDQIRILMGDEVAPRTKKVFVEGLGRVTGRLDGSIEAEKEKNDFLAGVPAIVEAIRSGKITCRVYRKDKFHAKAYITHARQEVLGSFALVGSSNLTYPGISENVELNVQITGRQVGALQDWYDQHWNNAEDVTPEILRVIERHIHEYTPFEVYAKALQEFFRGHEMTAGEWELASPENGGSRMYPVLDLYQKQGYQAVMQIARQHRGAFLCDGVGLGKTFIGLMIIERLIHDRKNVALLAPKTTRLDVWEPALRKYLAYVGGVRGGDYSRLSVFSHTDIGRGGDFPYRMERVKEWADAIVIDEAHHFRNTGVKGTAEKEPSRYWQLFDLIDGPRGPKQLFMLTATPINNSLDDFRHMVELYTRQQEDYFRTTLGIHSVRGHFIRMKRDLKELSGTEEEDESTETNLAEAERVLSGDALFRGLVVQRSRAYVKESQLQEGATVASFPTREPPRVADYSVKKTYGRLLDLVEKAFDKAEPLFVLGTYYPLAYYTGKDETIDPWVEGRQKQVVRLIRTGFLKRFESSAHAFACSCDHLLLKLLAWAERHAEADSEKRRLERWKRQHADLIGCVHERQLELWGEEGEEQADEDLVTPEMLEAVEHLERDEYKVEDIFNDTLDDLNQIAEFLEELSKFKPEHDDKLKALIRLLKTDPVLKREKVLIFTEFADTAHYLKKQLAKAGIEGVSQIDSGTKADRSRIIRRFAPYYNGSSSAGLAADGDAEIRVLISTDILSEGLNLQDATRLINYDLHWNPVRLMQRIGRVDRRMSLDVEERLAADHPEQQDLRGNIVYWNFLPPDDLEELLRLYGKVSNKVLRISKTFGIEGRKLLTPEDDYNALRNFNATYEGTTTPIEKMHLEFQEMLKADPGLEARLKALPGRVFSGKKHPSKGAKAVFFCYRIPRPDQSAQAEDGELPWTEDAGDTKWYLFDLATEKIADDPTSIVGLIRSAPDTPRKHDIPNPTLSEIRAKVERHIADTYLKAVQAPSGVRPLLKAWLELS